MNFMRFFEREIAAKGVPGVLQEYLFAEDFKADDMFVRLFMGIKLYAYSMYQRNEHREYQSNGW